MCPAQEVHVIVGKRNRIKNRNCSKGQHALMIQGCSEGQLSPRCYLGSKEWREKAFREALKVDENFNPSIFVCAQHRFEVLDPD